MHAPECVPPTIVEIALSATGTLVVPVESADNLISLPRPPLAITIAPDSIVDAVDILPNGSSANRIRISPGSPWVGPLPEADVSRVSVRSGRALLHNVGGVYVYPRLADRQLVVGDIGRAKVVFHYHVPAWLPTARPPLYLSRNQENMAADTTIVFPVYGRRRVSINLRCQGAGASYTFEIRGMDGVTTDQRNVFNGDGIAPLSSGSLSTAGTAQAWYSYEGTPYDGFLISLSGAVSSPDVDIAVVAYDE